MEKLPHLSLISSKIGSGTITFHLLTAPANHWLKILQYGHAVPPHTTGLAQLRPATCRQAKTGCSQHPSPKRISTHSLPLNLPWSRGFLSALNGWVTSITISKGRSYLICRWQTSGVWEARHWRARKNPSSTGAANSCAISKPHRALRQIKGPPGYIFDKEKILISAVM